MKRLFRWIASRARRLIRKIPWSGISRLYPVGKLLALVIPGAAIVAIPFFTSAWEWVPGTDEARTLLSSLLTAQAAIAALTLAVTQFVIQGVSARRDANDQMYNEYVRQSRVKPIFWGSILAVAIGGLVFVAQEFVREVENAADLVPGIENLILVSVISFASSLVFPILLFQKALFLLLPERWSTIRRTVNERGVLRAVEVFLSRRLRALEALEACEPDVSATFPDPDEGLADEAIRGLLGDARRAMSEHGLREFTRSLDSIKDLISYAMDEIERNGIGWSSPGGQPEWPPLRGLQRNLYSFREDVIREGNREYVFELLGLDYWLLSTGARRKCGELFTAGLESYRSNYQIANRLADPEIQELLRDRVWLNSPWAITGGELAEVYPYALELLRHQERMLSDALNRDQPGDYDALHKGFETFLRLSRWDWGRRNGESFSNALEQSYRVVLMGLSGRAITLTQTNRIEEAGRYLAVPRGIFGGVTRLADDIAQALNLEDRSQNSQWSEWEWEGAEPGIVQRLSPESYPLTFFAIRLMELSFDEIPSIDLHGAASLVLTWFHSNADRLLPFVSDQTGVTREKRRDWATSVLREAVKVDEISEANRIIAGELSPDRIADFKSGVYATALGDDAVERLFARNEAFLYLATDIATIPMERGFFELAPKAAFADMPSGGRIWYEPLDGHRLGQDVANDVMGMFCEALNDAPLITAQLDTPENWLSAFDRANTELDESSETVAVLAGDWFDIVVALHGDGYEDFVPAWQLPEADGLNEWGEYRGQPVLRGPRDGERRMYLVEVRSWGCFVRGQCEGAQDLHIDLKTISPERARDLLEANPNHFPEESEYEDKLRKLQTYVELEVCYRIGFEVKNSSYARRIMSEGSDNDEPP